MLEPRNSEPRHPARTVVIGARGFIGAALMARLAEVGAETLGLTSSDVDLTAPNAAERLAGLFRPDDAVVMLAALTPDKGRDMGTFMRNLTMAENVCAALEKTPVEHVVYVSSDAVYPMDTGMVTEDSCAAPGDLYGAMHKTREVMFQSTVKGALAVLRPTLVYGAADTHNSYGPNRLRRMAQNDGKITLFGAGEETRDHIPVEDVAALIAAVLDLRGAGLLNVASGNSITFDALAGKVAARFAPPAEVIHTDRNNPVTHRHFDISALRKALPEFHFTPLDDGLAKAHRDMMSQG